MMTKTEAGMLLAVLDEKIPFLVAPYSREMGIVAQSIKDLLCELHRVHRELKDARVKLERKIQAAQKNYNRLMEENQEVREWKKLHSFTALSEGKPREVLRRYVVKLENGDTVMDFLNENRTWRDHNGQVVKWMEIPDDDDRLDDLKPWELKKRMRKGGKSA